MDFVSYEKLAPAQQVLGSLGLINREQGGQWKHVKEGAPSILMCHPKCPHSFLHLYYL